MQLRFALGRFAAAAVRKRPQVRAALVSQLLLGEPVRLHRVQGRYGEVELPLTAQRGFVRCDQLILTDEHTFRDQLDYPCFVLDPFGYLLQEEHAVGVTFGARLPAFDGLQGRMADRSFIYNGSVLDRRTARWTSADRLVAVARRWLYVPESPSGRTPTGIGIAEFIHLLYTLVGVRLPISIRRMQTVGDPVDLPVHCRIGDLAFFDGPLGRLSHVGMLLNDGLIVHVDGHVRCDPLDHFGIYAADKRTYTHSLRCVKRVIDYAEPRTTPLPQRLSAAQPDLRQLSIF